MAKGSVGAGGTSGRAAVVPATSGGTYTEFESASEALAWGNSMYEPPATNAEANALGTYQTTEYWGMNQPLRGIPEAGPFTSSNKKKVRDLNEYLQRGVTDQNVVTYRVAKKVGDWPPDWNPGDEYTDLGFTSSAVTQQGTGAASTWRKYAPYRFKVELPAGTHGRYIANAPTALSSEHEFLIPPGSTFRFSGKTTGTYDNGMPYTEYTMRLIRQDASHVEVMTQ